MVRNIGPPPTKTKPIPEVDPTTSGNQWMSSIPESGLKYRPTSHRTSDGSCNGNHPSPRSGFIAVLIYFYCCMSLACLGAPSFCSLEPDSGPCKARLRRYHFNSTSGRCETFVFGGCQGNENNFRRRRDCRKTCRKREWIGTILVQKSTVRQTTASTIKKHNV